MLKTGENKLGVSWQENNAVDRFAKKFSFLDTKLSFRRILLMYLVAIDLRIHYYHKYKTKSFDSFILALLHIKHTISYQTDTLFILRCI